MPTQVQQSDLAIFISTICYRGYLLQILWLLTFETDCNVSATLGIFHPHGKYPTASNLYLQTVRDEIEKGELDFKKARGIFSLA